MAYAIIRTAGKQFKVEPGKIIRIPSVENSAGESITFGEVLLASDGTAVQTGAPVIEGASVTAEIVRHARDKKIVVFKFRRRKNYARKQGHRQGFTEVRIQEIKLARGKNYWLIRRVSALPETAATPIPNIAA
jgi:large subunit ribosomal protein L21